MVEKHEDDQVCTNVGKQSVNRTRNTTVLRGPLINQPTCPKDIKLDITFAFNGAIAHKMLFVHRMYNTSSCSAVHASSPSALTYT